MSSSRPQQTSPTDEPFGELEPVAYFHGAKLTGVTVSQQGRIFVNFPKWRNDVQFTVADPSFVITHNRPLEEGPELYETFRDKKDGCIKVVLKP